MTTFNIQLTESAISHINRMIVKEAAHAFRLSIKKTGCSGYSYAPSVVKNNLETDVLVETSANFPVWIDATYTDLLQELVIDLVEENNMGIKQKKLVFKNPRETARCGCGESFQV
jgi:iron-sulfur cluster assembly accessory protein